VPITYPYSRLQRFQERCSAMIADPECRGDLLLVGFALAHELFHHPKVGSGHTWREIAEPLLEPRYYTDTVKHILRKDIRRYDMHEDPVNKAMRHEVPCAAPMQRRAGLCGKRSKITGGQIQFDTGEIHLVGACSRADHQQWYQQQWRVYREEIAQRITPRPFANTGGVLARHFPHIDWENVYVQIDPNWSANPERDPADVPEPESRFQLILGEDEGGDGKRPTLQVLGDRELWKDDE
jgi:hypothetical protein